MNDRPEFVLVIEDDPNLNITLQMILEDSGYRVKTAMNGREALSQLEDGLPILILLDMKMPVMDGWEFARLFFDRYGRETPVVVLTAAEDAKKRAAEVNAHDYLGKPFDIQDLLSLIRKHTRISPREDVTQGG